MRPGGPAGILTRGRPRGGRRRPDAVVGLGVGLGLDLDEVEQPNGRSVRPGFHSPARGRSEGWSGGCSRPTRRVPRFPAFADLVATERPALAVEPAIADLCRDGSAEMTAGAASGARLVADPAARRLCLWCRAVRTSPHRHGGMVAASLLAVELRGTWGGLHGDDRLVLRRAERVARDQDRRQALPRVGAGGDGGRK